MQGARRAKARPYRIASLKHELTHDRVSLCSKAPRFRMEAVRRVTTLQLAGMFILSVPLSAV